MNPSMYTASIPVFKQFLNSLHALLEQAKTHCQDKKIEPDTLLMVRLFPDMFPLHKQIQVACDFAKSVCARLANIEVPETPNTELSFEGLQQLITQTTTFLDSLTTAQFEGSAERQIITRPGTPKEKKFKGENYLLNYGLPQFFFHVTTAYGLLRHNGMEIGKRHYMGAY